MFLEDWQLCAIRTTTHGCVCKNIPGDPQLGLICALSRATNLSISWQPPSGRNIIRARRAEGGEREEEESGPERGIFFRKDCRATC